jgi:hypothetical protein
MRSYVLTMLVGGLLLAFAGCSNTSLGLEQHSPSVAPLHGSDITGVLLADRGNTLELTLAAVLESGTFLRLELPGGRQLKGQQLWAEDGYIAVAVPTASGADVGVVALNGQPSLPLHLELPVGGLGRTASVPPVGVYNIVNDFVVSEAGEGQVELSWSQVNVGDYNFDGIVGISDLTPVGQLLGTVYDRDAQDAELLRVYWVDGNADGAITISDITAIGQNYGAYIAGYNVRRDNVTIPGKGPNAPTVLREEGSPRDNLPPVFSMVLSGSLADEWAIVSVDKQGVEGSGSEGIVGDINLRANIDINGLDFFNLDGSNPGPFDPSKFGTRVIDPTEIIGVARKEVPALALPAKTVDTSVSYMNLITDRMLYLDVCYMPTVDLVTGEPKNPASLRGVNAVPAADQVITSIPFRIPSDGHADLNVQIALTPNPDGGYYSELTVVSMITGDNPDTPEVEDNYTSTSHSRLAFITGMVSNDTDGDGSFEDEVEMIDSDLDGVSDARLEHDIDLNLYKVEWQLEYNLEGMLVEFNETNGNVKLTDVEVVDGGAGGEELPDPLLLRITEMTRFEEHVKTDEGVIKNDIDPSNLTPGDMIEVTVLTMEDISGLLPTMYWVEKLMRKIDERTGQ